MAATGTVLPDTRHDWSAEEVESLMALPFADLVFRAQTVHRR
ncbi:MAG: biotin synthase, partial [Rhodospirillaceae bacterium]|nr:biotin synthase [Rhodospirillaceae bacterium]MYK14956.1 biotin synthase [Rhodospirillaceae bacterium]MYK58188.1 biotin synthase [Rhodospirillaceae bacterium]